MVSGLPWGGFGLQGYAFMGQTRPDRPISDDFQLTLCVIAIQFLAALFLSHAFLSKRTWIQLAKIVWGSCTQHSPPRTDYIACQSLLLSGLHACVVSMDHHIKTHVGLGLWQLGLIYGGQTRCSQEDTQKNISLRVVISHNTHFHNMELLQPVISMSWMTNNHSGYAANIRWKANWKHWKPIP